MRTVNKRLVELNTPFFEIKESVVSKKNAIY